MHSRCLALLAGLLVAAVAPAHEPPPELNLSAPEKIEPPQLLLRETPSPVTVSSDTMTALRFHAGKGPLPSVISSVPQSRRFVSRMPMTSGGTFDPMILLLEFDPALGKMLTVPGNVEPQK
jgi:hypothetical protein